jgi:hypothetical protein
MADDASQKPVQVKLVLLGTLPDGYSRVPQAATPPLHAVSQCTVQRIDSSFFHIQVKQRLESPP